VLTMALQLAISIKAIVAISRSLGEEQPSR